ncbi:MAG: class II aldolase/adducin family protein [Anaerostipes sp.]|jgi:L-fuculose-phosphate aldolase|nr:class II aldolase/adducin family protein [Anaerostipes sp.]MDD3746688.1 class II aldolase/adducin family protein [Anaerostipes sp.]
MSDKLKFAKEEVVRACKIISGNGFVLGTAGNVSAIVEGENLFVITPSSYPYSQMEVKDLVVADLDGNIVEGEKKPSIEFTMHRNIYLERNDVKAIVHSHSPYATAAASIEGINIIPGVDIEAAFGLGGDMNIAGFAPPGSPELAEFARRSIEDKGGVLLANHGAIGVGKNMDEALLASDNIERNCKMYLSIMPVGSVKTMPEDFMLFSSNIFKEVSGMTK